MITFDDIKIVFEESNALFLRNNRDLFESQVSERTLCGALMLEIHDKMKYNKLYRGYYVDVEYNRNKNKIKTITNRTNYGDYEIIRINCDLIVHSRGRNPKQDNLLAIEMKKSTRNYCSKNQDRKRLTMLTMDSFDNIWSFDGKTLPEYVCRYVLGVYYEVNLHKKEICIEYYSKGRMIDRYIVDYRM